MLLDLPPCSAGVCAGMNGDSKIRCEMANGHNCPIPLGGYLLRKPGDMSGPVLQGLRARWYSDTDQRAGICYDAYSGNGQRLVIVPLVTAPGNGRSVVTTVLLGAFFLTDLPSKPHDDIVGEFLQYVMPGSGPPDSVPVPATALAAGAPNHDQPPGDGEPAVVACLRQVPMRSAGVDGPAPRALALAPPAPNPVRASTILRYRLPRASIVELAVFDVAGRRVRTLSAGPRGAGDQIAVWDLRDRSGARVPDGLYLVRLSAPDGTRLRRIVVLN